MHDEVGRDVSSGLLLGMMILFLQRDLKARAEGAISKSGNDD